MVVAPNIGARGGIQRYNERLGALLPSLIETVVLSLELDGTRRRALRQALRALGVMVRVRPQLLVLGYITFAPLGWAARVLGCPYVIEAYGKEIWRPTTAVTRMGMRWARAVWTVSAHTADAVRRHYPEARNVIDVKASIDDVWFQDREDEDRVFTIISVCRLDNLEEKGIDVCLDAVELVRERAVVRYRIVGEGRALERLRRDVLRRGLDDTVIVVGGLSDEQLRVEYAHADVLVLASPYREGPEPLGEGLGLVLLEAAAAGVVGVTTRDGGTRDAVVDGETGILFDQGSAPALADGLHRLATDPTLCAALGRRGSQWVRETYGNDAYRDGIRRALIGAGVRLED
jgi:phosphatidyl-myo-inositol dimannoside synthase